MGCITIGPDFPLIHISSRKFLTAFKTDANKNALARVQKQQQDFLHAARISNKIRLRFPAPRRECALDIWVRARRRFSREYVYVCSRRNSLSLVRRRRLVICISIFGFACRVDIAMVNYFIIPSVLVGGAAAIGSPGCVSRLLPPRAVFSREHTHTPARNEKERERELKLNQLSACGALDIYAAAGQLLPLHAIPPRIKTTPREKHPSHNWRECVHVKKLKARRERPFLSRSTFGVGEKTRPSSHSSTRAHTIDACRLLRG
jgi:hypothetical protein